MRLSFKRSARPLKAQLRQGEVGPRSCWREGPAAANLCPSLQGSSLGHFTASPGSLKPETLQLPSPPSRPAGPKQVPYPLRVPPGAGKEWGQA